MQTSLIGNPPFLLTDEIDKLKRKVQAATQSKETAEHQCIMEVCNDLCSWDHGLF